jgi:hypothetical protein
MQHNSRANISLRVKQILLVLASIGMAGCVQSMHSIIEEVATASELASIV